MNATPTRRIELPHEAYLAALASLDNVGPATSRWLLSHGSPRRVWDRVRSGRLTPGPGARVDRAQITFWMSQAASIDPGELWQRCVTLGIGVVSLGSAGYPDRLADDPDPPVVLFQRGEPERVSERRVAIVGTRRATRYGLDVAYSLGRSLTQAGVTVVSGLALGIDAAAHGGAVSVLDGPDEVAEDPHEPHRSTAAGPLAVVGANLEVICPRRNRQLADRVLAHGLIYSEVPPGTRSAPWRFPVRNRLVAALCDAVVVVESAANGGSMHTVREALDRDRAVLAVPGPIGVGSSEGTNQLIRDGAAPCLGVDDVLAEIDVHVIASGTSGDRSVDDGRSPRKTGAQRAMPTGDAALVLEAIGWRPLTLDGVAATSGLTPRQIAVVLATLESDGWIKRSGSWVERCIS